MKLLAVSGVLLVTAVLVTCAGRTQPYPLWLPGPTPDSPSDQATACTGQQAEESRSQQSSCGDEGTGGSKWDTTRHKLGGPAPGDLDRFPVRVHDGRVWVDARQLTCAGGHPCERVHKDGG